MIYLKSGGREVCLLPVALFNGERVFDWIKVLQKFYPCFCPAPSQVIRAWRALAGQAKGGENNDYPNLG